jgi:shikimate kinase
VTSFGLERVLLVGFMGSGKTSVGRVLAARLGWAFVDFDQVIEAEAGTPVADIFAGHGEPHFRELEDRVARGLLARRGVVLGSGGGWAATPGRLGDVPPGTATFWLKVSPEEALRRVASEPGKRPLLAGADMLHKARELMEARASMYGEADWTVDTEGSSVEDVAAGVLEILAREYPGASVE